MDGFQVILAIVFILAAGILMLTRPYIFWKIEHFLTVRDGKPSHLYLAIVRVCGLACILISIIFTVRLFLPGI